MSERNWRGNLIQQLFILVVFIQASLTHTSSSDIDNIVYLSFSSPKVSSFPPLKYRTSLTVVHTDDSPYSRVKLPWAFNFFGSDIFNIFVDPNGCVHETSGSTDGGPTPQLLNTSYYGTISGYLADLYPSGSLKTSNITSYVYGDMVSIIFTQITLYNTSLKDGLDVSFRISLFNDSRVVIDYDSLPKKNANLVSGLRSRNNSYSEVTSSQERAGRIEWKTKIPGVYPDKLRVQSGSQFTACPISKVWGIFPSTFDAKNLSGGLLFLSPFYYSCRQDLEIAVLFDKAISPCVLNDVPTRTQLLCNISNLLSLKKNGQNVTGQVGWRLKGSQVAYSVIGAYPLNLTMSSTIAPIDNEYSLNRKTPVGCDPRSLYNGDYKCLKLTCPGLYQHPVCGNTTFTKDKCSTDLAFDSKKKCCKIEQQDCAGECFGTVQIGMSPISNVTKMCCIKTKVDCTGICGGKAVIDACGVCQGKNFLGNDCGTKVFFKTVSGRNRILAKIDYSIPRLYTSISDVAITNGNNVSVIVNVTRIETTTSTIGPTMIASPLTFIVPPNSSRIVTVNVSVSSLLKLELANWEVKTLVFNYRRLTGTTEYKYPISVYPTASNCSAISGINSCMRAPACILCAEYPSLRVLTEQGGYWSGGSGKGPLFENSNGTMDLWTGDGGVEEWQYYRKRELFTGLIPLPLELDVQIPLSGVCMNGFASSICANAQFSAAPKMFKYPSVILALGGLLSFLLFIQ